MSTDALPHGPRQQTVPLPNGDMTLWIPMGTDALLDALADAPPDPDDKMPYWADLWPASIAMAKEIERGGIAVAGREVLEIGSGLGLVSLAAARAGANACATDWDEDALRYVHASAQANSLVVKTARLDWRSPPIESPAEIVIAADVLYEERNVGDVARALPKLLKDDGEAWIADPGRVHLPAFIRAVSDFEVAYVQRIEHTSAKTAVGIHLIRLRRK
ncbi:MAG: methyltransferase domain-containing protein [Myxococcota bacterium]